MDEKAIANETTEGMEHADVQNVPSGVVESQHKKGCMETLESVFTSPEGGFLGFALTLCVGYIIHAFTGSGYCAKVKTSVGTEVSFAKEKTNDE